MFDGAANYVCHNDIMTDNNDRKKGRLNPGGTPGNKGGTGRAPNEIREWFKALATRPSARRALEECLDDNNNRNYAAMWRLVLAYGVGMPKQEVEHKAVGQIIHTIKLPPLGAKIPLELIPDAEVVHAPAIPPPFAHPDPMALQAGEERIGIGKGDDGASSAVPEVKESVQGSVQGSAQAQGSKDPT